MNRLKEAEDLIGVIRAHLIENGLDVEKLEDNHIEASISSLQNWRIRFETKVGDNPCFFTVYHHKNGKGGDEAYLYMSVVIISVGKLTRIQDLNSLLIKLGTYIHPVKLAIDDHGYPQLLVRSPALAFNLEYVSTLIWALIYAAEEVERSFGNANKKASGIH